MLIEWMTKELERGYCSYLKYFPFCPYLVYCLTRLLITKASGTNINFASFKCKVMYRYTGVSMRVRMGKTCLCTGGLKLL